MSYRVVLLSIKPKYANAILNGTKKFELRKKAPSLDPGDIIIIYSSSPDKAIIGGFQLSSLISMTPKRLWRLVRHWSLVNKREYEEYFTNCINANALEVGIAWRLERPIGLDPLRQYWPHFSPPQNYRYLWADQDGSVLWLDLPGAKEKAYSLKVEFDNENDSMASWSKVKNQLLLTSPKELNMRTDKKMGLTRLPVTAPAT